MKCYILGTDFVNHETAQLVNYLGLLPSYNLDSFMENSFGDGPNTVDQIAGIRGRFILQLAF